MICLRRLGEGPFLLADPMAGQLFLNLLNSLYEQLQLSFGPAVRRQLRQLYQLLQLIGVGTG